MLAKLEKTEWKVNASSNVMEILRAANYLIVTMHQNSSLKHRDVW